MIDMEFIKDQLVNAWEHSTNEEMISHLENQTSGYNIKSIVNDWYNFTRREYDKIFYNRNLNSFIKCELADNILTNLIFKYKL